MRSVDGGFENEGIRTDRFLRRRFVTGVWITTLIFPHGFHITAAPHSPTWDLLILVNSWVTTPLILRHLGGKETGTSVNYGLVYNGLQVDQQKSEETIPRNQATVQPQHTSESSTRTSYFFSKCMHDGSIWPKEIILTIKLTFHGKAVTRNYARV